MRNFILAAAVVGLAAFVHADDKKQPDKPKADKPEASLKVGDPAPKLKADKWLQGSEVTEFASGKIYVVEFWATWCGPCIVMMPHMSEMQAEYKDKGVTFIGYSAKDPNNTEEKVAAFVTKRGPKLGYTFAYSDNRDTYDAYMKAAGRGGIPCSYVVDKTGKIAFIGHPMFLDVVLPKVVAGSWTEEDVKKVDDIEKDVDGVFKSFRTPDAEAGLKAIAEFETKYPALAHIPYFTGPKIGLLIKAKKYDEAQKIAAEVVDKATKQGDPTALGAVARALASPDAKDQKELTAMAVKAADAGVKLAGDKDLGALLSAADAHFGAGDKAKAREYGAKAVAAAANPQQKAAIERMVKKYDEEKKEEKKDDK
jgi:thiol-disulfide isomerase/thioredoxin